MPAPRFQSLGNFVRLADCDDCIRVTSRAGVLELSAAAGGTLRVRLGQGEPCPEGRRLPRYQSLALSRTLDLESLRPDMLAVKRSRGALEMRAPEVTARLTLEPLAVSFALPGSKTVFGQDSGLGFRGGHIVVRKNLRPGDHI